MTEEVELTAEQKQEIYAADRRMSSMKMGLDRSLHGLTHVGMFSNKLFFPDDERWARVCEQAHKALAEVLILQTHFELIVGALHKVEEE